MATYTIEYRDQLVAAISALTIGGVSSVSIAGQSVTALDLKSLQEHLKEVNADLAMQAGTAGLYHWILKPGGAG